jgi:hypothetical protein
MSKSTSNSKIYECQTKISLGGTKANWYSTGFDGSWDEIYPKDNEISILPEPIANSFDPEKLFNVSETVAGNVVRCVMGRVITTAEVSWSVVIFVMYAKDEKPRDVPLYRIFFCEGEDKLEYILNRVDSYINQNHKLPYYDPYRHDLANGFGFLNDCPQTPKRQGHVGKEEFRVVREDNLENQVIFLDHKFFGEHNADLAESYALIRINTLTKERVIKQRGDGLNVDFAWAYNADAQVLENPASFTIVAAFSQESYDNFQSKYGNIKIKSTISPQQNALSPSFTEKTSSSSSLATTQQSLPSSPYGQLLKEWNFIEILEFVDKKQFETPIIQKIKKIFKILLNYSSDRIISGDYRDEVRVYFTELLEYKNLLSQSFHPDAVCLYYIKAAMECDLNEDQFENRTLSKLIWLYALIVNFFRYNIVRQSQDINRLIKGSQSITAFCTRIIEFNAANQDPKLKTDLLNAAKEKIFQHSANPDPEYIDYTKWLWQESLWQDSKVKNDFIQYVKEQVGKAWQNVDVEPEFTSLSRWLKQNKRDFYKTDENHKDDKNHKNTSGQKKSGSSDLKSLDYIFLYSLFYSLPSIPKLWTERLGSLSREIKSIKDQKILRFTDFVQLRHFLEAFEEHEYKKSSDFFSLISNPDLKLKFVEEAPDPFDKLKSAEPDLSKLETIWWGDFLKSLGLTLVYAWQLVVFSFFIGIEYFSTGRITYLPAVILPYCALSFYVWSFSPTKEFSPKTKAFIGHTFISVWILYILRSFLIVDISLKYLFIIFVVSIILLLIVWNPQSPKTRIKSSIEDLLDALLAKNFLKGNESQELVRGVSDTFFPKTTETEDQTNNRKYAKLYFRRLSRDANKEGAKEQLKSRYIRSKSLEAILFPDKYPSYLLEIHLPKSKKVRDASRRFQQDFYSCLDDVSRNIIGKELAKQIESIFFRTPLSRFIFFYQQGNYNSKIIHVAESIAQDDLVLEAGVVIHHFTELIKNRESSNQNPRNQYKTNFQNKLDGVYASLRTENQRHNKPFSYNKPFVEFSTIYVFFNALASKLTNEKEKIEAYKLVAYFAQISQAYVTKKDLENAQIPDTDLQIFDINLKVQEESSKTPTKKLYSIITIVIAIATVVSIIFYPQWVHAQAINEVVKDWANITRKLNESLKNEEFKRFDPKPEICEILINSNKAQTTTTQSSDNAPISARCKLAFKSLNSADEEDYKKQVAQIMFEQKLWTHDQWSSKHSLNIDSKSIFASFESNYKENIYPSLLNELGSDSRLSNQVGYVLKYIKDNLDKGKYKKYGILNDIERDNWNQYPAKLAKIIYEYQFANKNFPVNGLVDQSSRNNESQEFLSLMIRSKMNTILNLKVAEDDYFRNKLIDDATCRFDKEVEQCANAPKDKAKVVRDTTKDSLNDMEFDINQIFDQNKSLSTDVSIAIVEELTSTSPVNYKYEPKIELKKAKNAVDNDRKNLIRAIFDYQIGQIRATDLKLIEWDGIINQPEKCSKISGQVEFQKKCEQRNEDTTYQKVKERVIKRLEILGHKKK